MAAGDTALWLHNKLGSTDDLWSGKTICSQLSRERLLNIQDCFHALQSHVKVKLLLSFLHIPRRNVELHYPLVSIPVDGEEEENLLGHVKKTFLLPSAGQGHHLLLWIALYNNWQNDLEEIISLGINDPDPWVATIGEIMRDFPSTGALLLVEQENRSDSNMLLCLDEIKLLAHNSTVSMMPLECQYLNKAALTAAAGHIPEASKHFTVKRKPKSAALRAEIIQKSSESVSNKRNHASTSVPIKSRSFAKTMDITPLKTTPSRALVNNSDFRSPTNSLRLNTSATRSPVTPLPITPRSSSSKKDSKIKLLEIEEMPVGAKEAKRRKKIADMAQEAQKKEKEAAFVSSGVSPSLTVSTSSSVAPSYTPDYAAGLIAPATSKMPITILSVSSTTLSQPSPAYLPNSSRQNTPNTSLTGIGALSSANQPATKQNLSQQLKNQLLQQPQIIRPSIPSSLPMMTPILIAQQPLAQAASVLATNAQVNPGSAALSTNIVKPQHTILVPGGTKLTQPQFAAVTSAPMPVQAPQAAQAPGTKKGLSLTKEQMIEAQEMFKASNKVSRPEKALILGFMAGSRENPCPEQGAVLNIKLSEKEEVVHLPDGTVKKKIEDTYFQMNYATGEWRRFQKLREMAVS